MDLQEFYMQAEKIALFPGNVDDLNRIETLSNSGRLYELMPLEGGKKYLTGVIIPNVDELKDSMRAKLSGVNNLCESGLTAEMGLPPEKIPEIKKELERAYERVEELAGEMIGLLTVMDMDIRMRAQQIGANGLVHIQTYDDCGIYMGVPVKL